MAYQKMRHNLHYMGAGESPFVPQSAAELTSLKLSMTEERRRLITIKVRILTAKLSQKEDLGSIEDTALPEPGHPLFLCESSGFGAQRDGEDNTGPVPWPTIVQLKEEGDRRAAGTTRQLPTPDKIYGEDRSRKFRNTIATQDSHFGILPVDMAMTDETGETEDYILSENDLPEWLQQVIGDAKIPGNI